MNSLKKGTMGQLFFYLSMLLWIWSMPAWAAKGATDGLVITSVSIDGKEAELNQYERDGSVYIASDLTKSATGEIVIQAMAEEQDNIRVSDCLGHEFQVARQGETVTITRASTEEEYELYGAYTCHLAVGDEDYTLILNTMGEKAGPEVYLLDATEDTWNYMDENLWMVSQEASDSRLRLVEPEEEVKSVAVECNRNLKKSETYSATGMKWLLNGENYVRINQGSLHQFSATSSDMGSFSSGRLSLKKGLNIVELYNLDGKPMASVSQGNPGKEGLSLYSTDAYLFSTYLIYWDGEEQEYEPSGDTTLRAIDAVQLGSSKIKMTQYASRKEEDGNFVIALPENLPADKIILGLEPTDPDATVQILRKTALVKGDKMGIYQAVKISDELNEINVRVTAANKKDTATWTIRLMKSSGECDLTGMTLEGAKLKTYDGEEIQSIQDGKTMYLLQKMKDGAAFTPEASEGAKIFVDGEPVSGEIDVDPKEFLCTITVRAEDGVHSQTYYFLYQDENGNVPLIQQPTSDQKEQAEEMLAGWRAYLDGTDDWNENSVNYWGTFKAAAVNADFNGKHIYDVSKHQFNQATDYAGCILELVMVGENPYDFKGKNLVEGLYSCENVYGTFGGYGNNIWALQALKTLGEPISEGLIEAVKRDCSNEYSIDLQGWAAAALKGVISDEELIALTLHLRETQLEQKGTWGNAFTNGCVISGIVNVGLNLDYFSYDGKSLLEMEKERDGQATADGNKDMVIAMGDILNSGNLYHRYAMTEQRWENLIAVASKLIDQGVEDAKLQENLNAMQMADGFEGNGELYYRLLQEVGKQQKNVWYDGQVIRYGEVSFDTEGLQLDAVEGKNYKFTVTGEVRERGWITEGYLETAPIRKNYLYLLQSADEDYSQVTHRDMASVISFKDECYLERVYFVMILHYYGGLGDDNVPDSTVTEYGPIKVDRNAPTLQVSCAGKSWSAAEGLTVKQSETESLTVNAADSMSGIYRISYQVNGGTTVDLYSARDDGDVNVDACGKGEITAKIPVQEAGTVKITVEDLAGYTVWADVTVAQDTSDLPDQPNQPETPDAPSDKPAKTKKDIAKLSFGSIAVQLYTGKKIQPSVTVKDGSTTLAVGKDYVLSYQNNKKVGKASVTVKGTGDYTGIKTLPFYIKKSLKKARIAKIKNQTYRKGKAVKPSVKVTYKGKKLKKGRDYTVAYKKNKKVGKAVVLIKGKGNYTGTRKVTFKIVRKK